MNWEALHRPTAATCSPPQAPPTSLPYKPRPLHYNTTYPRPHHYHTNPAPAALPTTKPRPPPSPAPFAQTNQSEPSPPVPPLPSQWNPPPRSFTPLPVRPRPLPLATPPPVRPRPAAPLPPPLSALRRRRRRLLRRKMAAPRCTRSAPRPSPLSYWSARMPLRRSAALIGAPRRGGGTEEVGPSEGAGRGARAESRLAESREGAL